MIDFKKPVWVIVADGEIDQICETAASAAKEKRDLVRMGCTVRVKACKDWHEANAFVRKFD